MIFVVHCGDELRARPRGLFAVGVAGLLLIALDPCWPPGT
jgi:hypothetical protein